ncbi:TPA: phage polarity suppression protein [Citrobacter freundii]|uniref:phage polarity suppression protein n=1 Tax=Citrobacter freundii TaxID=546 RepID=UPI001CE2BC40|nr:phage polarity suppression protein [Citrobacter freundii]
MISESTEKLCRQAVKLVPRRAVIVRERALDHAAASVREALSVHVTRGGNIDYAEEDRDILTTIGFRPDRASRDDNRAKYTPEQSQIFMRRQAAQTRKKSA